MQHKVAGHKQAGLSQSKVTEAAMQESREAAQRADPQNPDKLAAAGHTSTGQTLPQQAQAAREHADPEVRQEMERVEAKTRNETLGLGGGTAT